jgi:hypothetical protein
MYVRKVDVYDFSGKFGASSAVDPGLPGVPGVTGHGLGSSTVEFMHGYFKFKLYTTMAYVAVEADDVCIPSSSFGIVLTIYVITASR